MDDQPTAVVYYPPTKGYPFLAVVMIGNRVLACEPVKSLVEGETVLKATMRELPRLIQQAEEEDGDDAPRS